MKVRKLGTDNLACQLLRFRDVLKPFVFVGSVSEWLTHRIVGLIRARQEGQLMVGAIENVLFNFLCAI